MLLLLLDLVLARKPGLVLVLVLKKCPLLDSGWLLSVLCLELLELWIDSEPVGSGLGCLVCRKS